eukprot:TRINITY_DN5995_c0_g2_i1.p1 TRINITY_DN5995_c0_g2~~TRINITY_DN5995_c0_g2_i1.p1  ORF type:complete len:754 (+),score=121.97 TRINITY_DN5995_c0_g2_i1:96-2264(+)
MDTVSADSGAAHVTLRPEDRMDEDGQGEMEQDFLTGPELPKLPQDEMDPVGSSMTPIQRARSSVVRTNSLKGFSRLIQARDDNPRVKVDDLSGCRKIVAVIVKTELFDIIIIAILLMNLLFVVVDTELRARDVEFAATPVEFTFLACFCLELLARIFVDRCSYFGDALNKLDFIIVIADLIVQLVFVSSQGSSFAWLRLFRTMRLLRVIRRMHGFRELWLMLHGLSSAAKAMTWAIILMVCFLTVWSLVAIALIKPMQSQLNDSGDFDECGVACTHAFDTIPNSILTWFFLIFAGELWKDLVVPIVRKEPAFALIFFAAFVTIHLGLMNLILTVIVDRAAAARVDDEQLKADEKKVGFEKARAKLVNLCETMDIDQSGCLTLDELEIGFQCNEEFSSTLKAMDVAKEDLRTVFQILDEDRSGSVTYDEFVAQLHKMKTQEAQTLLVFIKHYVVDVRQKVSEQLDILKSELVERVDEHAAITNRLARRMGRVTGIDMCATPLHSNTMNLNNETPLSPSTVHCAGSPRVVQKGCFSSSPSSTRVDKNISRLFESADRNFSTTEPSTDAHGGGGWHELGQTSGLAWSRQNFGLEESRIAKGPSEISSRMESMVCTELRRLSERVELAMSAFLRDSVAEQEKHTESLATIEQGLQELASTCAIKRPVSDCSGDSGPINAVIVPMANQRNYPITSPMSPGSPPGVGSLLEVSSSKPSSPERKTDLAL